VPPAPSFGRARLQCHCVALHPDLQLCWSLSLFKGRVVVQAVSRRIPIAMARVRARLRSCGLCGRQSSTGAGFLRVHRFPLPLIPPTAQHHHPSFGAGTVGQLWPRYQVDSVSHPPKDLFKETVAVAPMQID
jgi:hypothetical protein